MKKDDVLERSRKSGQDEGVEYAENQGRKTGFIVSLLLLLALVIYCRFVGEETATHALFALFWAQEAAISYRKFCFVKEKGVLLLAIAESAFFVINIVRYIAATWR